MTHARASHNDIFTYHLYCRRAAVRMSPGKSISVPLDLDNIRVSLSHTIDSETTDHQPLKTYPAILANSQDNLPRPPLFTRRLTYKHDTNPLSQIFIPQKS